MNLTDHLATLAAFLLVAAGLIFLLVEHVGRRLHHTPGEEPVPSNLDRRRHHRQRVARVTALLSPSPSPDGLRVENLSPGGMCLAFGSRPVPADSVVQATILTPDGRELVTAEARAVWVEGDRAGLAFARLEPALRHWLDSM